MLSKPCTAFSIAEGQKKANKAMMDRPGTSPLLDMMVLRPLY